MLTFSSLKHQKTNIPGDSLNSRTGRGWKRCPFLSHLGQAGSLDQVIEFPQRCVPRETLDVPEQVLRLRLKETPEGEKERMKE